MHIMNNHLAIVQLQFPIVKLSHSSPIRRTSSASPSNAPQQSWHPLKGATFMAFFSSESSPFLSSFSKIISSAHSDIISFTLFTSAPSQSTCSPYRCCGRSIGWEKLPHTRGHGNWRSAQAVQLFPWHVQLPPSFSSYCSRVKEWT